MEERRDAWRSWHAFLADGLLDRPASGASMAKLGGVRLSCFIGDLARDKENFVREVLHRKDGTMCSVSVP